MSLPPPDRLRDGVTPGSTIILPRNAYKKRPGQPQRRGGAAWWFFGLLAAILVPLLVLSVYLSTVTAAIGAADPRVDRPATVATRGYTVLIVGVDDRSDGRSDSIRSDTVLLARVNPGTGGVAVYSIPRDTRVEVRGRGTSKINAAYAYGYLHPQELYADNVSQQEAGMALAAETVEWFLDLPGHGTRIDYMLQINFDGFTQLIDALGGVTVDVPAAIVDPTYPTADYGTMRVEFAAGPQLMDGARALIYARTRHSDSDFGRNQRQQIVIQAVLTRLRTLTARELVDLAITAPPILGGTLKTTMPFSDPRLGLALVQTVWRLDPAAVASYRLSPQTVGRYTVDGSDLLWDTAGVAAITQAWVASVGTTETTADSAVTELWGAVRTWAQTQYQTGETLLRRFTGIDATEGPARVQVLNGARVAGLARRVTQQLNAVGFLLDAPGDVAGTVPETIIYDITNHPIQANQLTQLIDARVVRGSPPMDIQSSADIIVVLGTDYRP